tara:strand:+ start:48 stop:464 length:417 start_codon:yes stop_codon:yes gene_type:complete
MKNIGNTIEEDYTLVTSICKILETYHDTQDDPFIIGYLTGIAAGLQEIHNIKPGDSSFSKIIEGMIKMFDELYGEANGKLALGLYAVEMQDGRTDEFNMGMSEGSDWCVLYLRGVSDEPVMPTELIMYLSMNHKSKKS